MTRRENKPPEDNYPDGVLMIFAGRDPARTKAALESGIAYIREEIDHDRMFRPETGEEDIRILESLIRQIDE